VELLTQVKVSVQLALPWWWITSC